MVRGNCVWQTPEYLGLFPKIHNVKFRKHFGFDLLFFIGLKLRPSVGFLREQGELNQAVIVEHRNSVSYRVKVMGKHFTYFGCIQNRIDRPLDQRTGNN